MTRALLACAYTLILVTLISPETYACCEEPVASFLRTPVDVCIGGQVSFDASASYDPDYTYLTYSWDFGSGAYDIQDADTAFPTCRYNSAGYKYVTLTVTDNDDPDCCGSQPDCSDKSDTWTRTVTVVKVDKVVELGTTNEGPLYVCSNVDLEAIPYPAGASFPVGEPHWTIEEQPEGANASLSATSGSATTTLYNLTVAGKYTVKAKCGGSDAGDTIDVYVDCTPGRNYAGATNTSASDLIGVRAKIKTRYAGLCCEPYGAVAGLSVALCSITDPGEKWAETGYDTRREQGSTTTRNHRYAWMQGNTVHYRFDNNNAPSEGSTHTYSCHLDKSTGQWTFYYDGAAWISFTDSYWKNQTGDDVVWSGEIYNKEDDMPGTSDNKCNFTNCQYCKDGGSYQDAGLNYTWTDNANEWGAEYVSGTAFNIWDKKPGE